MTDFQSEQLDYDRNGNQICDLKHSGMLTMPRRDPLTLMFSYCLQPQNKSPQILLSGDSSLHNCKSKKKLKKQGGGKINQETNKDS